MYLSYPFTLNRETYFNSSAVYNILNPDVLSSLYTCTNDRIMLLHRLKALPFSFSKPYLNPVFDC